MQPRAGVEASASRATRAAALRAPAAVGLAGVSAAVLLHLRDPHESGAYGYCPFLVLAGQPCPGCGGLRAANDLTRGDLVGALSSNALAVALAAALVVAWVLWLIRRSRGRWNPMIRLDGRTGAVVLVALATFGAFRLTPWGAWLAP